MNTYFITNISQLHSIKRPSVLQVDVEHFKLLLLQSPAPASTVGAGSAAGPGPCAKLSAPGMPPYCSTKKKTTTPNPASNHLRSYDWHAAAARRASCARTAAGHFNFKFITF